MPLTLALLMLNERMVQWGLGPKFVILLLGCVLLLAAAVLAPRERPEGPPPWHAVLLVTGLALLAATLVRLAQLLGASHSFGAGAVFWTLGLTAAAAVGLARRFNSGICTLIAAVVGAASVLALVEWAFAPHSADTFRWVLLALGLAYAAGAARLHAGRRRHAVMLADAAGLTALAIAVLLGGALLEFGFLGQIRGGGAFVVPGWFGWKLWLLVVGLALVAYGGFAREPGPAYVGVAVLAAFVFLAAPPGRSGPSLVGWPLFLLAAGGAGVAFGLRPRRDADTPPAATPPAPSDPPTERMPPPDAPTEKLP